MSSRRRDRVAGERTSVLVVGTGLIGTSVGLALQQSPVYDVLLQDSDERILEKAVERGAGRRWNGREATDLVLVAVPPAQTAGALIQVQRLGLATTYTHVASVQSQVQREVESLNGDMSSFVGGHPLAGREVSGPEHAAADLFAGRPWAVCPAPESADSCVAVVRALAEACGGQPVELDPELHDSAVGLLSHLPQVVASGLAGSLPVNGDLRLSGPGLADTTRLAASDADLWTQILSLNAAHVSPPVRELAERLAGLADALDELKDGNQAEGSAQAREAVLSFLQRGNAGRSIVPVKRGVRSEAFARVSVSVSDEPGQLAGLLNAAAAAGVNVEDVHVDHVPGRPRGVIDLLVDAPAAPGLASHLDSGGWLVVSAD